MMRMLAVLALLVFAGAAHAQGASGSPVAYLYCYSGSGAPTSPASWGPCSGSGSGTPLTVTVAPYPFTPLTPGQYTPVSDAAATALTIPSGATYAVICADVGNHRYTWDGTTTPTAAIGTQIAQGSCVSLSGAAALAAFKIIQQAGGGTFTVSYAK